MPKTLVRKVAYHNLEEEAMAEANVLFDTLKELLGIEDIDSFDNFLSLGDNSLKAMELKSLLEEKGYDIQLSKIFNATDIQSIKNSLTVSKNTVNAVEYPSVMPITHAQNRVYTSQMMSPESTMYNNTIAFMTENLNSKKLYKAINTLIKRHESLRTHFENRQGQIMQIIDDSAEISLEKLKNDNILSFVRPFDMTKAPLSKFSGNEDIVTGMPVSGRSSRFLNTVGMFVNTIALRSKPEGCKKVLDLMNEIKDSSVAAIDNQNCPFGELVQRFYKLYSFEKVTLHNLYDPTECAVGVRGELCIGGTNVGQGYLGNKKLTAEKFIENPFSQGRLYKTGDIAYFRNDGNIIFCGRMDNQIKLNGQRIEIGEIEAVISDIQEIESAAVIVQKKTAMIFLLHFTVQVQTAIN